MLDNDGKKKGFGSSLIGLFVVQEKAPEPDPEPGPEAPPRGKDPVLDDPVLDDPDAHLLEKYSQGDNFDLGAVLRAGDVSPEEQDRVGKALALLNGLPAETPPEVKRQIVAASLQAFGIQVDKIIESALLHVAALDGRMRASDVEKAAELDQKNRRVSELNAQLEALKQELREVGARYAAVTQSCQQHQERIRAILDFFGDSAVQSVRQTSVRLRA